MVYVSILDGDILPPECRTDGYRVFSKLQNIPKWNDEKRTTLIIRKTSGDALESTPDEFVPHGLNLERLHLAPDAVFVDLCDLTPVSRISDRISRVAMRYEDSATATCVLKIARFKHEVSVLQREVSVYSTLSSSGFMHAPKFMGLVYEEKSVERLVS